MRLVSWFLMFALVLALGILIASTPTRTSSLMVQEAAEVQVEEVFAEVMVNHIIAKQAVPYTFNRASEIFGITFHNETERSEDRTVYCAVDLVDCHVPITGVGAEGDHPLKGPLTAGRAQVYTMGRDCQLRPFT